jgi:hypothetical protein
VRDVTKTKPSHYRSDPKVAAVKAQWPATFEGAKLATEVRDNASCSADVKARIIRDIIEYEGSHGSCTQTFQRKVRKLLRPSL